MLVHFLNIDWPTRTWTFLMRSKIENVKEKFPFSKVTCVWSSIYMRLPLNWPYFIRSCFAGAFKVVIFTNIIWLLLTILLLFALPPVKGFMLVTTFGVLFLVVPPVNYIRALLAIRRHNAQLGDAVTLQMSVVLQREKRVALDTCIVAGLLFASLPPAFGMSIVQKRYPRLHSVLLPWSLTMTFIPSCANPVIYFVRFKNMRNAFKSIINI